jgi:hypothetical protein
MRSFIDAARWLGEEQSAKLAELEYDSFYKAFRRACARDTLEDDHGNAYVPTVMGPDNHYSPQKAQWAFCHAVSPGAIFAKDDPLVEGQLAMLRASKVEDMVCDTGYLANGIWTYFASFYAHAHLWQGHGSEAAHTLYAFAQHACPTRVWREEQRLFGEAHRSEDKSLDGDMPHNWASAEFIRLTTHLIEQDRGDELHLFEGFPPEWAGPAMVTRLEGVLTPFGELHLELRVANDGHSARFKMKRLQGRSPAKVVLHLAGLTGRDQVIELATDRDVNRRIELGSSHSPWAGRT